MTEESFARLAADAERRGDSVEQAVIRTRVLPAGKLNVLLADELNVPYIDLANYMFEPETVRPVPAAMARRHKVIPAFHIGDSLTVAMANPDDIKVLDELRRVTGRNIMPALSSVSDIERAINDQYGESTDRSADVAAALSEFDSQELTLELSPSLASRSDEELADEAPIVRFVSDLLEQSVRDHVSDIHIEPDEQKLRVRVRVDGVMHITAQVRCDWPRRLSRGSRFSPG